MEKDVGRLDMVVKRFVVLQVENRFEKLVKDELRLAFRKKTPSLVYELVKITTISCLLSHIEIVLKLLKANRFDYIFTLIHL